MKLKTTNNQIEDKVIKKLREIETNIDLIVSEDRIFYGNLSSGMPGAILFYQYMHYYTGKQKYLNSSIVLFEKMINGFQFNPHHFSHCSGLAGIHWLFGHLTQKKVIAPELYSSIADTESYLYNKMTELLENGYYDFLHESLGIFFGLLQNDLINIEKESVIETVVSLLEKNAISVNESQIYWPEVIIETRELDPTIANLGLSHGIPSIISILCITIGKTNSELTKQRIALLIEKSSNFLLFTKNTTSNSLSCFSSAYYFNKEQQFYGTRLGWCYGDLGIATTFWHVYKALGNEKWKNEAIELIMRTANRRNLMENRVADAGICHGSAGISHIFNRFFEYTGEPFLRDTSSYWINVSVDQGHFKDGVAGYKKYNAKDGYLNTLGFLEGPIGVGLTMISYLSKESNKDWDNAWLIS